MDISGYSRKTRQHAQLLRDELLSRHPSALQHLVGSVAPVLEALGITLRVVEKPTAGCSVAGSSDHRTQTVSVAQATKGRMRFTALHELGHLLGHDADPFQDAIYAHAKQSRRAIEEDACDAFAALLLLPDERVDALLGDHGLSARGLRALIAGDVASREACAVAVAQRLRSPGYALVIAADGTTQFAARSGDVLPIARGADQTPSELSALLRGGPSLRGRGALSYRGGSSTHPLYIDAISYDRLVLAVACESDPDWYELQTPVSSSINESALLGHCDHCGTDFQDWQCCRECGEPQHATCGRCGCDTAGAKGERPCTSCFMMLPPAAFAASSTICVTCAG